MPLVQAKYVAGTWGPQPISRGASEEAHSAQRQVEVAQLDERIAAMQVSEQAQYLTISTLEANLDRSHAHLASLEARVAELEGAGQPGLDALRELSTKQSDIAATLKQLISDNQGQAQARATIIESQRQQLAARHRRNLLKQVGLLQLVTGSTRCDVSTVIFHVLTYHPSKALGLYYHCPSCLYVSSLFLVPQDCFVDLKLVLHAGGRG